MISIGTNNNCNNTKFQSSYHETEITTITKTTSRELKEQQTVSSVTTNNLHEEISIAFQKKNCQILKIARLIQKNSEIIKLSKLLEMALDSCGNNAFHKTADLGSIVLMEHLLHFSNEINPNSKNLNGDTVLHILSQNINNHNTKFIEIFRMFINCEWRNDIEYDIENNNNQTPLQLIKNENDKQEILQIIKLKEKLKMNYEQ